MRGRIPRSRTSKHQTAEMVFMSTFQIRLHRRRKRRRSGCQSPRWSLRRDLKGAVRQQCPGKSAGGGVSGRRTVLQRWIQDRSPSPQVHWILRGYIKNQNVSRRGSLSWKQLLRLATEWRSRNVQIAVARTHYLRGVGASVRPDTILRREKPPVEMNICNTMDNLQTEMSVMLLKMANGSPPAEVKNPYGFGYTTEGVIRDDGDVREMIGEVCHEPTSVAFGRFNVRLRS